VSEAPDQALIDRYLAGDADAFAALVRRHQTLVYNLCLRVLGDREDAADAAQEALIIVARKLDTFRGDARFTTWLHRVTMNVCYDQLRAAKRRPAVRRLDPDLPEPELGPAVEDHADEIAGTRDAAAALAIVPEEFRIAVVLADVQDLPYEEIAKILDVPVGTVKSRVHRGRLALARAMGIQGQEPLGDRPTSQGER
jgi:RNA polymerase sigma-70 factor (ECF subfamily)